MKVEGLKLFVAAPPFAGMAYTVMDREGAWTQRMLDGDPDDYCDPPMPPRPGFWVWEGACHSRGPSEAGWVLRGMWRHPTPHEVALLGDGRLPLRGAPITVGMYETFEVRR